MLFNGLKQGTVSNEDRVIIAAGPLTRQPNSMPYRHVIIRYADGKFSVHTEQFDSLDGELSFLTDGYYFKGDKDGFIAAQRKFAERIAAHAEYHATVYRTA